MIILGLTGSIGMGKSTAAGQFRRLRVPVFDADATVHRLQATGGRALAAIEAAFPGVTGPAGLDRQALGAQVFGNPVALRTLEAIIHPLVHTEQRRWLMAQARRRVPLVVLDVPLLFERGGWRGCDIIAVVSAPAHVQRLRVLARPGMTPDKFAAILRTQLPDAHKRRRADVVIATGRGKAHSGGTIRRLVRGLAGWSGRQFPPGQAGNRLAVLRHSD
jgi:dephospho-CoA kinase